MAGVGGGEREGNGGHKRQYLKENTVLIDVLDNSRVKAKDVIDGLCEIVGEGTVYTCVTKASNLYEVTLADGDAVKLAVDGVKVGEKTYDCREVVNDTLVVSFMYMSGFIDDEDILIRLEELGVEVLSEIKRRLHQGTNVEDGTRYVRVRFPPTLKSLPYSMRFNNGKVWEHVRVIHSDQVKTCRQCMSTEHLFRECPEFICYKCGRQGHVSRLCKEPKCDGCDKFGLNCVCDTQTLEECEHCGKCACQCEETECSFCERPVRECNCGPDDICKFCSVEIRDCQCLVCDSCGERDCWCNANTSTADNVKRPPDPTSNQSGGVADKPVTEQDPPVSDTQSTGSTSSGSSTSPVSGEQPQSSPKLADNDRPNAKPIKAKQKQLKQMTYADQRSDVCSKGRNSDDKPILRPSLVNSTSNFKLCVIRGEDGECLVTRRRKNVTNEPSIPVSKRSNRENNVEMM